MDEGKIGQCILCPQPVNVTLRNVTLRNGWGENGGGVDQWRICADNGTTMTNNTAVFDGGAVWLDGGAVTIDHSTMRHNHADAAGGVIAGLGCHYHHTQYTEQQQRICSGWR